MAGVYKGQNQAYREERLESLHRMCVINGWLNKAYEEKPSNQRDYFKGVHKYGEHENVRRNLNEGKVPISCARSKTSDTTFYIFSYSGNRSQVKCLTIEMKPKENSTIDTGMHFCKFVPVSEEYIEVEKLSDKMGDFVLMLPYFVETKEAFNNRFTLVYHDWDVLRLDKPTKKGIPSIDEETFSRNYFKNLR